VDEEVKTMSSSNGTNGLPVPGDPIGPGFFRSFSQEFGKKRIRQAVILGVVTIVVVVALSVGLIVFSSISHQSQSYKDGFTAGGGVYASDSTAQLGARQACKVTERLSPNLGGLPLGANATQWLNGCVISFESAQSGN
jgi:hypothetical protein